MSKELTTPSGHKVFLIERPFTYGDKRKLQRAMISRVKADQQTKEAVLDGSGYYDAEDLAVKMYVEKIITKEGQEVSQDKAFDTILSWSEEDGDFVFKAVNEFINSQGTSLPNLAATR